MSRTGEFSQSATALAKALGGVSAAALRAPPSWAGRGAAAAAMRRVAGWLKPEGWWFVTAVSCDAVLAGLRRAGPAGRGEIGNGSYRVSVDRGGARALRTQVRYVPFHTSDD